MLALSDFEIAEYAQYKLDAVETYLPLAVGIAESIVLEPVTEFTEDPVDDIEEEIVIPFEAEDDELEGEDIVKVFSDRKLEPPIERIHAENLPSTITKILSRLKVDKAVQDEYMDFLQEVQFSGEISDNVLKCSVVLRNAYFDSLVKGWQNLEYTFTEQCMLGLVFGRTAYVDGPLPVSAAVAKYAEGDYSEHVAENSLVAFMTGMQRLGTRIERLRKPRTFKEVEKEFEKRTKAAKKTTTGDA